MRKKTLKAILAALCLAMTMSFVACGSDTASGFDNSSSESTSSSSSSAPETPEEDGGEEDGGDETPTPAPNPNPNPAQDKNWTKNY